MTKKQIELSYQLAVDVFNEFKTLKEAKDIGISYCINENSMKDYCDSFRHMMHGTKHTRSIGSEVREYFLFQIFCDYNEETKNNALTAFELSIEYYERRKNCICRTDRGILEKYKKLLQW